MERDGRPLVSIITPSYNQATYIKQTIQSVLTQDYDNLELIIVDGGSTDGTMDILRSFEHLDGRFHYVSEPDAGQAEAINKGLQLSRGSVIGWLNSDDMYLPGAVRHAVDALEHHKEWGVVYGKAFYVDEAGCILRPCHVEPFQPKRLFEGCIIAQPAAFLRKEVLLSLGGVDDQLRFCMDYELWIRASREYNFGFIDEFLAHCRVHDHCKSSTLWADVGLPEIMSTSIRHFGTVSNEWMIEYMRAHEDKGPLWLLERFKTLGLYGDQVPKISESNRYDDHWSGPSCRFVISAAPLLPACRLLIKGSHMIPYLNLYRRDPLTMTLYVDGTRYSEFSLDPGPFIIDIPIWPTINKQGVVDLVFSYHFVPVEAAFNSDTRSLSCILESIVPCSQQEYEFYSMAHHLPNLVERWIKGNRTPIPV